jgi:hypothetical protein
MKNIFVSTIAIATIGISLLVSCKKDGSSGTLPTPPDDGTCRNHAKGTIEQCNPDSNLWLINTYGITNSPVVGPMIVLAPQNLPQNFKVNLTNVDFDFEYLNDSILYQCGCFPLPNTYAKKIRICNMRIDSMQVVIMKPVIYLYPTKKSTVDVKLKYEGKLTITYPDYNNAKQGWTVEAKPDGSLLNKDDGQEYQYLFWEGVPAKPYDFDMTNGYCVKGSETKKFLQTMLPKLGLTSKEYNDMIVFWLPKMMNNRYNVIHFAGDSYTKSAPLHISPKPDNVIRVFLAYQASDNFVEMKEPVMSAFSRKGFTVVEWGGVELPANAKKTEVKENL